MRLQEGKRYIFVKQWEYGAAITAGLGKVIKPKCIVGKLVVLSPMGFQFDVGLLSSVTFTPTEDKDIVRGLQSSWVILDPIDLKNP